jgi:hypothetical protein
MQVVNGNVYSPVQLAYNASINIARNAAYTVTITLVSYQITVTINGTTVLSTTDSTLSTGSHGFLLYDATSKAVWKGFTVTTGCPFNGVVSNLLGGQV